MGWGSAIHPLVFPISKNCFPGVLDIYTPQIPNSRWTTKQLKKKGLDVFFRIMVIFGGFYVNFLGLSLVNLQHQPFVKLPLAAASSSSKRSPRNSSRWKISSSCRAVHRIWRIFPSGNFGLTKNPHFYGVSKKILRRFQKKTITITVQWILTLYSNG